MLVVPENDKLNVEARVDPGQVDRLHVQLPASLRFTTLGGRTTPEFEGVVENISPDIVVDQRSGAGYYTVRVSLPREAAAEVAELGVALVPGIFAWSSSPPTSGQCSPTWSSPLPTR